MEEQIPNAIKKLRITKDKLDALYPHEAKYCSRCVLWTRGLNDGIINEYLYNLAKKFYKDFWECTDDTPREL